MEENGMNVSDKEAARKGCTFYCFSPPVMLATFTIESALAVYTLFRYRKGLFSKAVAAILSLLAIFQLSEYQICGDRSALFWARIGFVATTLLPVMGLYLVSLITRKRHFLRAGYVVASVFVLLFVLTPTNIISPACGGNYVIFSGPEQVFWFYSAYYLGFVMLGIWESVEGLSASRSKRVHRLLRWMVVAYLSFMLPTGIVYAAYAPARLAVASVMCGFAVIMALILAFQVVPKYYRYSQT